MPPKLICGFLSHLDCRTYADAVLNELPSAIKDAAAGGRNRVMRLGWSYEEPSVYQAAPTWLVVLAEVIEEKLNLRAFFNSFVLNEYLPGNFVAAHLDPNCDDPVAILSLESTGEIWLRPVLDCNAKPSSIFLPIGSLLVLTGDSLRKWTHEIPPVIEKRLSIVFRRRSFSPPNLSI